MNTRKRIEKISGRRRAKKEMPDPAYKEMVDFLLAWDGQSNLVEELGRRFPNRQKPKRDANSIQPDPEVTELINQINQVAQRLRASDVRNKELPR